MVRAESVRGNRSIGVLLELKHAAYFDSIGLPLDQLLLADLRRHEVDHPRSRVSVMSFEPTILRRLASHTRVELVPLLRSEERRVGKEGVSTCRSRWLPDHKRKHNTRQK